MDSQPSLGEIHRGSESEPPLLPPSRSVRACGNCRRRKVACNHQTPCDQCVKRDEVCFYEMVSRRKRGPGKRREYQELLQRVGTVETLLRAHASKDGDNPALSEANAVATSEKDLRGLLSQDAPFLPASQKEVSHLISQQGKSAYTTDALFAELTTQIEDIHTLLQEDDHEDDQHDSVSGAGNNADIGRLNFIPGLSYINSNITVEHPESSHVLLLWRVYLQNVEPLMKTLHVPSIQIVIDDVAHRQASQALDVEALLSAIYLAAITSLGNEDVVRMFGQNRSALQTVYRARLEQALSRANFLTTKSLRTLQAFVLLICSSRRTMPAQYIWMLTGMAIRKAKALGLQKDGKPFGLSSFDCEMRRRLWWQIYYLEVRISEECGCEVSISEESFDTKLPLNINDVDIYPGSKDLPPARSGVTDMSFTLVRAELIPTELSAQHQSRLNMSADEYACHCEAVIQSKCKEIDVKYLQGPGMHHPQTLAAAMIKDIVAKRTSLKVNLRLLHTKESGKPSQEVLDALFQKSIDLLESSIYMETESFIKHWAWQSRRNIQWHAVVFVLMQLCVRHPSDSTEAAWRALDSTFAEHDEELGKNENGLHFQLILRLLQRARAHRAQGQLNAHHALGDANHETPAYNDGIGEMNIGDSVWNGMDLFQSLNPFSGLPEFDLGATPWDIGDQGQVDIWDA